MKTSRKSLRAVCRTVKRIVGGIEIFLHPRDMRMDGGYWKREWYWKPN